MMTTNIAKHKKTLALRNAIKKAVDQLSPERLSSLADYVHFLSNPTIEERLKKAKRDYAEGKCVDWRKVRNDV
ncbi:MAG: hypothetical protein JNJ77_09845 [Planctomycetia bacterium]|nr:hypothetical protein [Planctomycetia bacterium]